MIFKAGERVEETHTAQKRRGTVAKFKSKTGSTSISYVGSVYVRWDDGVFLWIRDREIRHLNLLEVIAEAAK